MSDLSNKHMDIPELKQKKNILGQWSGFFIKRYRVTILFMVIIFILGVSKYNSLQREQDPKVIIPYAFVNTVYIGASPKEVESLITEKIEEKLGEVEDIKNITSDSGFGYSSVVLEFDQGVDVEEKVREVREKLSNVDSVLPEDAEAPVVSEIKTGLTPVLTFTLSGDKSVIELQEKAKKLEKEIEKIRGVKDVGIVGDLEKQITVKIDPQKLALYQISLQEIQGALSGSNVNLPGGDLKLEGKYYNVRTVGRFKDIGEIGNVVIKYTDNGQVYLKDIAAIHNGYEEQEIFIRKSFNLDTDAPIMRNAVSIGVLKKESADELKMKEAILNMLEEKKDKIISKDMSLELVSDLASYTEESLGTVESNALSGLLLVVVVLFIFIGFWESITVAIVIPLALCVSFVLMKSTGMTLNGISMFALVLAVGMLVDNAIVVVENIDRLRENGLVAKKAAEVGVNQIAPAIMSSTLTTVAAFFPLLLTSGIMGDFIRPLPMTVIFTLTASFIIAITVTPSISSILLRGHKKEQNKSKTTKVKKIASIALVAVLSLCAFRDSYKDGMGQYGLLSLVAAIIFGVVMAGKQFKVKKSKEEHFIIKKYADTLYWIISKKSRKLMVIVLALILFVCSLGLIPAGIVKVELMGKMDIRLMYVTINTPPGTSEKQTKAITEEVEKRLFGVKEIEHFVTNIGIHGIDMFSNLTEDEKGTPTKARIMIDLGQERYRERKSYEIAEELRERIKGIPGAEIKVVELQGGPPSGEPIDIKLLGEDLDELQKTAADFQTFIKEIPGTRDVKTSIKDGIPEIQVKVDKVKAAALGLDNQSIAFSIRNAANGLVATTFRDGQDEIDVILKTTEKRLKTIYDLEKIYFYTRSGTAVPFSQVAEFLEGESIQTISHDNGIRQLKVTAKLQEGSTAVEAIKAFEEIIKGYSLPDGVTYKYGGEGEVMAESFGEMMINMLLAAMLVFIILAIQFNSFSQPLIIMFTVPMAIIGVMAGLAITGYAFSFFSFVGLVGLIGIAVNDAIVLIDYINYLRKNGYEMKEAIKETGMTRFMPVMATTITTAGGILPLTIQQPMFASMGITIIAGLCMATVLTLVIVPTMYSIFEGHKLKKKMRKENRIQMQQSNM